MPTLLTTRKANTAEMMSSAHKVTLIGLTEASKAPCCGDVSTEICTEEMIHQNHHQPTMLLDASYCQPAGFLLARHISLMTWYGFQRLATGTKYQPTAQPGEKRRLAAPSAWRLEFTR